jgi:hypothetical protein
MKKCRVFWAILLTFLCLTIFPQFSATAQSLKENNEVLFESLQRIHGLTDEQMNSIRSIFHQSGYTGQGNPAITEHPLSPKG